MNFHKHYALRGFFDNSDDTEGETGDSGVKLPENARLYYVGNAVETLDKNSFDFESSAAGTLSE